MTSTMRRIRITPSLKRDLTTYAQQSSASVSGVLRDALTKYADVPKRGWQKSAERLDGTQVKVIVDDAVWEQALARARAEGVALSEIVRRMVEGELGDFTL